MTLRKWQKRNSFWAWFRSIGPKFELWSFFQKSTSLVSRSHGLLSSCKISSKTNDLTLRKLSGVQTGRRTDRRTDRQTDESDFIGLCPTNVERPTGRAELLTFYKKTFMLSIYFYHIYFQAEFLQHVQELTPIHPACLNRHTSSLSGLYYFILLCVTLYICIIIETHG